MEDYSFEQLPRAVSRLQAHLDKIERLLIDSNNYQPARENEVLTVEQCATFLNLSKPTIYDLMSKREIPYHKRSKRCYFFKSDLIEYLKLGRKPSLSEIEKETTLSLKSNVKKGGKL